MPFTTRDGVRLHGTQDRLVRLAWGQELAEVLPHARLVTYEGAGHNYLVAAGEQANADVLEFPRRGRRTGGRPDRLTGDSALSGAIRVACA